MVSCMLTLQAQLRIFPAGRFSIHTPSTRIIRSEIVLISTTNINSNRGNLTILGYILMAVLTNCRYAQSCRWPHDNNYSRWYQRCKKRNFGLANMYISVQIGCMAVGDNSFAIWPLGNHKFAPNSSQVNSFPLKRPLNWVCCAHSNNSTSNEGWDPQNAARPPFSSKLAPKRLSSPPDLFPCWSKPAPLRKLRPDCQCSAQQDETRPPTVSKCLWLS